MIARLAVFGLVASIVWPAPPATAQPSPAELTNALTIARAEIPAMAARFGFTGAIPIDERPGGIEVSATGISLNGADMANAVGHVTFSLEDAVRLIVAHEVWHYVEIVQGGRARIPTLREERRLYECRADLMAGRYLSQSQARNVDKLQYSSASFVADETWPTDQLDYPRHDQRVAATHFGALTTLRDDPELPVQTRVKIHELLDTRSGETFDTWRNRVCKLLTHFGEEALGSIVAEDPKRTWGSDGLRFDVAYRNVSPRRSIEVTVNIGARDLQSTETTSESRLWNFPFTFVLEPGGRRVVSGTVTEPIPRTDPSDREFYPYIEGRPSDATTLITARFVDGPVPRSHLRIGTGLSRADVTLGLRLLRLANDAGSQFANSRGAGGSYYPSARGDASSITYDSAVAIPGTDYANIWVSDDGSSYLSAALDRGKSLDEVKFSFEELAASIRRIWPDILIHRSDAGQDRRFWFKPTRFVLVAVELRADAERPELHLVMQPAALGLKDPPSAPELPPAAR